MAIPKLPNYHHLPMIDHLNGMLASHGTRNNVVFGVTEDCGLELIDNSIGTKIAKTCLYSSLFCCCPCRSRNDKIIKRQARALVFACIRLTYGLSVAQTAFAGIGRDYITVRQAVRAIKYATSHNQGMAQSLSDKVKNRRPHPCYNGMAMTLAVPSCRTDGMKLVNSGAASYWQSECIPCKTARLIGSCLNLYDSAKNREAQKEGVEFFQEVIEASSICPNDVKTLFAPHNRYGYITAGDARRLFDTEEALVQAYRWHNPHLQRLGITIQYGFDDMIFDEKHY